jgi:hypothetical protein
MQDQPGKAKRFAYGGVLMSVFAALILLLAAAPARGAAEEWRWPVSGRVITPYLNDNGRPYAGGMHRGIDIAAPVGTPVVAAHAGRVTYAGALGSSGLTVAIETADKRRVSSYLHLSEVAVKRGAFVSGGERIGAVGTTGTRSAAEPHLHFGVHLAGPDHFYIDPLELLPPLPGEARAPAAAPLQAPAPARAHPAPVPVAARPAPAHALGPARQRSRHPLPADGPIGVPVGARQRAPRLLAARRPALAGVPARRAGAERSGRQPSAVPHGPAAPRVPNRLAIAPSSGAPRAESEARAHAGWDWGRAASLAGLALIALALGARSLRRWRPMAILEACLRATSRWFRRGSPRGTGATTMRAWWVFTRRSSGRPAS